MRKIIPTALKSASHFEMKKSRVHTIRVQNECVGNVYENFSFKLLPVRNFSFSHGSHRTGVDLAIFHEFKWRWRINLWRLSCFPFSPRSLDGKCRIYLILFLLSAEKCGIYLKPFVFGWFILFMETSHYSCNDSVVLFLIWNYFRRRFGWLTELVVVYCGFVFFLKARPWFTKEWNILSKANKCVDVFQNITLVEFYQRVWFIRHLVIWTKVFSRTYIICVFKCWYCLLILFFKIAKKKIWWRIINIRLY